ncbi:MAG: G5 domain-containing protein [Defluviitaleaceae bacterium]|nr:G5 domain-containing protein [Defluviitaleaceae bacterium]
MSIFSIMQSNLTYENSKEVTIIDGNELIVFSTDAQTIGEALVDSEVRFGHFDELSVEKDAVVYDGKSVEIFRASSVIINDGGTRFHVMTTEPTIDHVLRTHEIEVGDDDELAIIKTLYTLNGENQFKLTNPSVIDGTEIMITRLAFETKTVYEYIDFEVSYIYTDDLLVGNRQVQVEGSPKIVEHVMMTTFKNGDYYSTGEVGTNILDEGMQRVVAIGTAEPEPEPEPTPPPVVATPARASTTPTPAAAPASLPDVSPLDSFTSSLTFYNMLCEGCSGRTASGHDASTSIFFNDSTFGTIRIVAAGSQFPFGSVLEIEGHGIAVVLDRGGVVVGNVVDLLIETHQDPWVYGRQARYVRVLRLGW